jgi:predicted methyltransferase
MRTLSLAAGTLLAALAFSTTGAQAASGIPKPIAAAVADPARPDADRKADADRKPDESVAFAGLKPGQKVADLLPGGGYFTRIFSAVVGPTGHVFAVAPAPRPDAPAGAPDRAAAVKAIAADPHYSNVSVSQVAFATLTTLALPEPVDLVWTSRNYHDLHNIPNADVGAIDKAIFDALKPGGVYIVLDHAAEKGSGFRDTSTLHRVDPEAVKKEVVAAGFKFEGQSEILRNPNDPHTAKVFDASVQGKTDQFILKFRKPK